MAAQVAVMPLVVDDSMNNVSPSTGLAVDWSARPAHASTTSFPSTYAATCRPTSGPSSTSTWSTCRTDSLGLEEVTNRVLHHIHAFKAGVVVSGANDGQQEPVFT